MEAFRDSTKSPTPWLRHGVGWLLFLLLPGTMGWVFLSHLEQTRAEARGAWQVAEIREILGRVAARSVPPRQFADLFDRMSSQAWTSNGFLRKLAGVVRANPEILTPYVFSPTGDRLPIPGVPETMIAASRKFFQGLTQGETRGAEKLIAAFAGNADAPKLLAKAPGVFVDLYNGDRLTWGGWWRIRDARGNIQCHLVVFLHRGKYVPEEFCDRAAVETTRLAQGAVVCGWYDPLSPQCLRPRETAFPQGLERVLAGARAGQSRFDLNGRPVVTYRTEEGEVFFGVGRAETAVSGELASWRHLLVAGMVVAWLGALVAGSGRRSLQTKLLTLLLLAGGMPLSVCLATVYLDRHDREALLVKEQVEVQRRFLTKLDGDFSSHFVTVFRDYRRIARAVMPHLENGIPFLREALQRIIQSHRGLITRLTIVNRRGDVLFFGGFADPVVGNPSSSVPESSQQDAGQEGLADGARSILFKLNDDPALGSASVKANPVVGVMVQGKNPNHWFDDMGVLSGNMVGRENVLSYYSAFAGPDRKYRGILYAAHNSRQAQVGFLQPRIGRGETMSESASRLFALPAVSGTGWPAFPRGKTAPPAELQRIRDLVLTTGLPQFRVLTLGRVAYLISAIRGRNLDGYVLFLATPYSRIIDQSRVLTQKAGGVAVGLLGLALFTGLMCSRLLLQPMKELGGGLTAMRNRQFQYRLEASPIAELGQVAMRCNERLIALGEMELARSVQETLWPSRGLSGPGWLLEGKCRTAAALGGDFFDWFVRPDGIVVLAIGDVAGHGVPSGLVAGGAKMELAMNAETEADPGTILRRMNEGLRRLAANKRPMSFWLGLFDPVTGTMRYANAGHNFPVLIDPAGRQSYVKATGYPLGSRTKNEFVPQAMNVAAGSTLVLYTDGLVEALGANGQPWGYEGLARELEQTRHLPVAGMIVAVFDHAQQWSGAPVPEDDQTLVVLRLGEPS
jgi:hypothetical protein